MQDDMQHAEFLGSTSCSPMGEKDSMHNILETVYSRARTPATVSGVHQSKGCINQEFVKFHFSNSK